MRERKRRLKEFLVKAGKYLVFFWLPCLMLFSPSKIGIFTTLDKRRERKRRSKEFQVKAGNLVHALLSFSFQTLSLN